MVWYGMVWYGMVWYGIAFLRRVLELLVTVNAAFSSLILFTLMMEVISSSVTSVFTRTTLRHILERGIFHRHGSENLKPYNFSNTGRFYFHFGRAQADGLSNPP
jgi:hypothetical protein